MADNYYTNGIQRRKKGRHNGKKKRRTDSIWVVILDLVMRILTIAAALATLLVVIMQYIPPQRLWSLPVLTLIAPIIYILDIVATLYWIIRWKWWHTLFIATFTLLGTIYLPLYYKVDITRQYPTPYVERNFTKVISYNVANGNNKEVVEYIAGVNPDIICIQEYLNDSHAYWDILSSKYGSTVGNDNSFSCEIYAKYPILRKGLIDSLPRYNGVWADLKISNDTLRVINLHLQSTSIRNEDTQFIQHHEYIFDNKREEKLRSIVRRLTDNTCKRAEQAERIHRFIGESPYRVIVCGDFNDVPLSYSYHRVADGLNSAFREAGIGFAHTFDGYFRLLQIDHILVSPDIEVISHETTDTVSFSDHYPVVARLKLNQNDNKQ